MRNISLNSLRPSRKWHDDPPTESQMRYIARIFEEAEMPIPEFTGKTKGEAAAWIEKNRYVNYERGKNA